MLLEFFDKGHRMAVVIHGLDIAERGVRPAHGEDISRALDGLGFQDAVAIGLCKAHQRDDCVVFQCALAIVNIGMGKVQISRCASPHEGTAEFAGLVERLQHEGLAA